MSTSSCSYCKSSKVRGCQNGLIPLGADGQPVKKYWERVKTQHCPNLLESLSIVTLNAGRDDYAQRFPIPALFAKAGLDITAPIVASDNQLQSGYRAVLNYKAHLLAGREPTGASLAIFGRLGVGKSHLAAALCNELRASPIGWRVIFLSEFYLLKELRDSFRYEQNDMEQSDLVNDCIETQLLVVDDAGKARPTGWVCETLFGIFDGRYRMQRPTVITSNLTSQELAAQSEQWQAIVSRWLDNSCGRVVTLSGANLRQRRAA